MEKAIAQNTLQEAVCQARTIGWPAVSFAEPFATAPAKILAALSLNQRVPANAISVESDKGIVNLRGEVNDDETRTIAVTVAKDTPGVQEVRDHLFVTSQSR